MERFKNTYSPIKKYTTVPDTFINLYQESAAAENKHEVIGGIISDSKQAWVAIGPYLQVFYANSSKIRSVWCFGAAAKEPNAEVVCVHELKVPFKDVSLLVVGLKYGSHNGMVCVFDASCGKILRAIEIPEEVTSLHVVSAGYDSTTFPGPLSAFDGIICVGTAGGSVFIVDLCKEMISDARKISGIMDIRNESRPCQLHILNTRDVYDLEKHKTEAEQNGTHLAILLNERETSSKHFVLKTPQGQNVIFAAKEEVTVSTLQYAPQLCSLFVGYNFGALQIWNFLSMTLEYTSPVYEEKIPVSFIAIQEPVDDPRAFCYFWAIYSCTGQYHNVFPLAALYSLNYESKDYHEGYGHIYQNLHSCAVRFQANLKTVDTSICKSPMGANCIRLHSYSKGVNNTNSTLPLATGSEESYTLCMMVWNVKCEEHKVHTYMSLFDLNQWYKEQMPSLPHQDQCKNYMTNVALSDVTGNNEYTLDAYIDPSTIDTFIGGQKLEEHYRPSSLAYNVKSMTEIEVCSMVNLGAQRYFFKELEDIGPLALMNPADLYTNARVFGLSPLFTDLPVEPPVQQQCEALLSIALERRMLQWLCKCATSWGNGGLKSVGLTLDLLLNWGWERTRILKANADRCCTCLFDYSGAKLDANLHSLITACRVQFGTLKDLFSFIVKNCDSFLNHRDITQQQLLWLQRNYAYFNVIGWMINLNLLPETKETYPVEQIRYNYTQRRNYLQSLESVSKTNRYYLFIDYLTDKDPLQSEWHEDGTGEYPPGTLQTLLRCYFNNSLDIKEAHILIAYALLDLVNYENNKNENVTAAMIKFPQIFDLSLSATKTIQSFWQLDHGQLEPAVNQLSSRMIHPHDIQRWQHKFIIDTLKVQGQYRLALMYAKARNIKGDKNDVKNLIQLHVRNKMLFEALCIERRHADSELLEAFFIECMHADLIMEIVNFNFTKDEERIMLEFLENFQYSKREEFKTIYFVGRGRFLDFYMRHDKMSAGRHAMPTLVKNTLDAILPEVTKKVINTCLELKHLNYNDPKALSAYVCDKNERARFQNNFVKACVVNCKDSWSSDKFLTEEDFPFMRPPFRQAKCDAKKVLYPKSVDKIVQRLPPDVIEQEVEPPTKRMRLSPSKQEGDDIMNMTSIQTMHFQRSNLSYRSNANATTPHSILKTPHSHRGESTTPEDLESSYRSMTPQLSARPLVTTPCVRFSGISSSSSSASFNPTPIVPSQALPKETSSTTTDYYSAEASPEKDSSNRKRKLSNEEYEDHSPSVLRSTSFQCIGNVSANKFLESMRNTSIVEERLPSPTEENQEISHVSTFTIPTNQSLNKSDVFVFTGDDALTPKTILSPKSRDSYQKSSSDSTTTNKTASKKSLSRKVLEANASKVLLETEAVLETTTVTKSVTKEISITESNEAEKKTIETIEKRNSTCEKSVYIDYLNDEKMEVQDAPLIKKSPMSTGRKSYQTTPAGSPQKVNNTIIEINDSRPFRNKSYFEHSSFIDYFADSDASPSGSVSNKKSPDNARNKSKDFHRATFNDYFAQSKSKNINVQEMEAHDAEVENITKNIDPLEDNDDEPPEDSDDEPEKEMEVEQMHLSTIEYDTSLAPTGRKSCQTTPTGSQHKVNKTIIEINDSRPIRNKSYFEHSSFIDYFADSDASRSGSKSKNIKRIQEVRNTEVANITKNTPMAEENDNEPTEASGDPDNDAGDDTDNSSVVVVEKSVTPKPTSETIIEINDSPRFRKSFFESSAFIDYFADSDVSMNGNGSPSTKMDASAADGKSSSKTTERVDVDKKVEETPEEQQGQVEETIEINDDCDQDDQDEGDEEVNIYEDISNPSSSKYIMDPVMNNYNVNQDLVLNEDEARYTMQQENNTLPSDSLPIDPYLAESMDDNMDESSEQNKSDNKPNEANAGDLNTAVIEIISIGSTSSSDEDAKTTDADSESYDSADVAFIAESGSDLDTKSTMERVRSSCNTSTNSKENLDENVNEVNQRKATSKSDSDDITIVEDTDKQSESSVDVQDIIQAANTRVSQSPELSPIIEEFSTPVRRTRSLSMKSDIASPSTRSGRKRVESPALTITLRPRRSSASSEAGTPVPEKPLPKAISRTRSMSVDTPPAQVAAKRATRTRSVDGIEEEKKETPKKRGRKSILPAIEEEYKPKLPARRASQRKSESENDKDVLKSRRLTRHQKQIIEETSYYSEVKTGEEDSNSMDRLQLMDKDDFTGKSDPDEVNLLKHSPTSSIASSSAAENARNKRVDNSDMTVVTEVVVTKKARGRPRKTPTPEPAIRNASTSSEQTAGTETSRKVRAGSVDSGSRTSRRNLRNDMTAIEEENESAPERTSTLKRGRPRKNSTK